MNLHYEQLIQHIRAFNQANLEELVRETGLQWLGVNGLSDDVFLVGPVRARALFLGADGRYWTDATLVVESLACNEPSLREAYTQAIADPLDDGHDMWIFTETRGKWNAIIAPINTIAATLGYPVTRLPGFQWARTWGDLPHRTDEQELGWLAYGGKPLAQWRQEVL